MTIEDDIAFLSQVPVLRRLGAPAVRILAIGAEAYSVEAGQTLFAAGDAADCAYVVQQGSFQITPERTADADLVAEPGSLLGEDALLVQSPRLATAIAREDAIVLRISRAMFLRMLDSYPEAAQRLRELIASRADQWAREMDDVRAVLARNTGPRS
jgi:CRP-like cAMP-binding protein